MRRAALALLLCVAAGPVHVTVDFAQPADYPLSKSKFAVFNSGMVRPDHYARDMPLYDQVRPDSLRVDLGWGARWIGWKTRPIAGTADHLTYDFTETDRVAKLLRDHGVPACWSYCYTPTPLQPRRGNYQGVPTDEHAWAGVLRTMAAHYRAFPGGNPVGYQEVGNEPDNRDFFTGDLPAYQRLYQLGSRAIRDGDPDAVVGGPALAFSSDWVDPFLDRVVADHSPLDFYSFHYYPGVPYSTPDLDGVTNQMRDALQRRPSLRTAELHLNEWNPYKIDYPRGGRQDRYPMAADFLHHVKRFLAQPWLTRVYFAQFQDSGGGNFSGMIDLDGHRKAVFNAYAMYAQMPIDRARLETDDPAVEGLASAGLTSHGARRCDVLLWNRSDAPRHVGLSCANAGAVTSPVVTVRRVDRDHNSPGDGTADEPLTAADPADRRTAPVDWSGDVPAGGVVCVTRVDWATPHVWPFPPRGRIVRELHDYPDRASPAYADFDRRTWTARLGLAGDEHAVVRVGATVDGWPDAVDLHVELTGRTSPRTLAGLRLDYQGRDGRYTKAVQFYRAPPDNAGRYRTDAPVWGTGRPGEPQGLTTDNGTVPIPVRAMAPPDWTGRVQVSFVLADGGPDVRATFRLAARP